jgi:sortase A
LAILHIEKIGVRVAVFDGTDENILNRGVGRIKGTSKTALRGNFGIAGHRDGFFRGLKDVVVGDKIQLITQDTSNKYTVDTILIVNPEDVHVLDPGPKPSLTLVTCYPFYFIGHAPKRYIIKATLQNSDSLTRAKN